MSNRKKRLLFTQILLFSLAISLLYIFYYQGNKSGYKVTKKKVEKETIESEDVSNFFEDVEYKGIDANGNRYLLQSKKAVFDEESPELINMVDMQATFYFKEGKILQVFGNTGKYNNKTNDMEFRDNVKVLQAENKIFADNLDYFNLKKLIKIYGNVKGESFNGNFTADILNLNINTQSVDFLMTDNEQVNINLTK
tara:strand:- start:3212 stop:3799 length:588 start_codon:yes stop_codon:yes gene_type:complete